MASVVMVSAVTVSVVINGQCGDSVVTVSVVRVGVVTVSMISVTVVVGHYWSVCVVMVSVVRVNVAMVSVVVVSAGACGNSHCGDG